MNYYVYVSNNPLRYIDPSGHAYCEKDCDYAVYLVAGVQTSNNFFNGFKDYLISTYDSIDKDIFIKVLFPYGDNSEDIEIQAGKVMLDASKFVDANFSNGTGGKVKDSIVETYAGGEIVIIGHSGGGVAGYQGAVSLEEAGYSVKHVAMIGSPKTRINDSFRDRVSYIYDGFDPITLMIGVRKKNGVTNGEKTLNAIWGFIY